MQKVKSIYATTLVLTVVVLGVSGYAVSAGASGPLSGWGAAAGYLVLMLGLSWFLIQQVRGLRLVARGEGMAPASERTLTAALAVVNIVAVLGFLGAAAGGETAVAKAVGAFSAVFFAAGAFAFFGRNRSLAWSPSEPLTPATRLPESTRRVTTTVEEEPAPRLAPEPVPEPQPQPKPEVQPELTLEPPPAPEPAPAPAPRSIPEPVPPLPLKRPEPVKAPEPVARTIPEPVPPMPQPKPAPAPAPKLEPKVEPKPEAKVEPKPEPAKPAPAVQLDLVPPAPKPEPVVEVKPAPAPEPVKPAPEPVKAPEPAPVVVVAEAVVVEPGIEVPEDDFSFDEEIREIFVEEAEEVLETLNEHFPQWAANFERSNAFGEVRRGFHTLKGSGRMVGAKTVSELAWTIENMLNRVRDKGVQPSQVMVTLISETLIMVPDLVEDFANSRSPRFKTVPLMVVAEAIARGEPLSKGDVEKAGKAARA